MQAKYNRVTNTVTMKCTPEEMRVFLALIGRTSNSGVRDITGTWGSEIYDRMLTVMNEGDLDTNVYHNGQHIFDHLYARHLESHPNR